jgi:hypothetical protein
VVKLRPEMVKPIGGGTVASFHLGMRGLSVCVDVHVQLMCESLMALTMCLKQINGCVEPIIYATSCICDQCMSDLFGSQLLVVPNG